jgi:hypothetical protein
MMKQASGTGPSSSTLFPIVMQSKLLALLYHSVFRKTKAVGFGKKMECIQLDQPITFSAMGERALNLALPPLGMIGYGRKFGKLQSPTKSKTSCGA